MTSPLNQTQAEREREYEIKHAADVLIEAEQIKKDKKLLSAVTKELEKRRKAISAAM